MARHPIDGIKGSKPRVPDVKSPEKGDGKISREELSGLNRQYLESRNRAQAAKAAAAEMEIAQRRGQLISKRLAGLQVGYMLTCHRQRLLAEPAVLAARLVSAGFFDETRQHEAAEMIKADLCAMLEELADLPFGISDRDWVSKIDPDLRVQDDGESGGRVTDPSAIRRKAEQAKRRRVQKTATMRRLRAEGRVKS